MGSGEVLFCAGIAIRVLAAVGGVIAIAALKVSGKKLSALLTGEYGEKRH